jgi:hypothetical protein
MDGLAVTALVADSGVHRIYQVRDPATQRLYALKTWCPPARTMRRSAPRWRTRPGWPGACSPAMRRYHLVRA